MVKSGWFFGRPLGPLLKTGLPLMKNAIKALVKSVLFPLGLTKAAQQHYQMQEYIKTSWDLNLLILESLASEQQH